MLQHIKRPTALCVSHLIMLYIYNPASFPSLTIAFRSLLSWICLLLWICHNHLRLPVVFYIGTCPSGKAWVDIPTATDTAHATAECSNKGLCDRSSGKCGCFEGFTGDACQRLACPSTNSQECSGHGKCMSMKRMASQTDALPLSAATTYTGAVKIENDGSEKHLVSLTADR